ncbi:MAG: prevent-host-death protein [Acidobacteria bacterium]|nr:prevent-host-death protein [Acidobacteriota bacterium]
MRSVGLKVLNNKLSEYVRLAAAGETVLVTDRDRVVAEIVPPRAEPSPILADALLADMVRKGLLAPPAAPGTGPPSAPAPIMTLEQLLEMLDEVRGER